MTVGSKSYVRPLFRVKSCDALFSFPSVIKWSTVHEGDLKFDIPGCILFLLCLKAGSATYPKFVNCVDWNKSNECGWSQHYETLDVKYSREFNQTKPVACSAKRGSSLSNDNLMMDLRLALETSERMRIK